MCGIVGYCSRSKSFDQNSVLDQMVNQIIHRGPDDEGKAFFESKNNGYIGFGHRRLSIIDLSPNGRQPMESASGRYSIIFNGEIYNYRVLRRQLEEEGYKFRTGTDTEVILNMYEEYGQGCLQYFNGMFAFAIYDKLEDKVFLARDRLGIRPLYYYSDEEAFVFASEVKALLKFPLVKREADYGTLHQYVQNRYVRNPDTIFLGIKKLEPGHFMVVKGFKHQICRYWDIGNFDKLHLSSMEEYVGVLEDALKSSVRLRMISDVPFGAFLSGGIDSSLIVALMSMCGNSPVKTFSVGFMEEKFSELPYARQVADRYQTEHHELIISYKDVTDNIYSTVWHRDAPVSEVSDIPVYLLSKEAGKTVSVILTGEGSDEIFAGYPKYAYDVFAKSAAFRSLMDNGVAAAIVNSLPYKYRKLKLAYNTLRVEDDIERYGNWFAAFSQHQADKLFAEDFKIRYPGVSLDNSVLKGLSDLDRMMYMDVKYWLTDNLLERGDKMLMAASVEGRLPFLDHKVVELAFKFEDKLKLRSFNRKYIIKKLAEKYIPRNNIYRKKVGFYIPVGDWFRKELKEMVQDHLLSSTFKERSIFNNDEVERIVNNHCKGIQNHEKEIWTLLNLEVWFRTFIDSNP